MTELEKAQTALFIVIRNNAVMLKGLELRKSEEEIDEMAYNTMLETYTMIDFDRAFESYKQGKQKYLERSKSQA